jgi:Ca-activated chloride channel family protein
VTIGEDGTLPDLGYWGSATIVLFSDGEDAGATPAGGGGSETATGAPALAQKSGVHIETVGVGTATGTTVEVDGFRLHTALDAAQLTALAESTGGRYHPASDTSELEGVASTIDLRLTVAKQDVPLAGGLTAVALALLAAGALLTGLRTGRLV